MTGPTDITQLTVHFNSGVFSTLRNMVAEIEDVPDNVKKCLEDGNFLCVDEILWLHENLKGKDLKLHECLMNAKLMLPQPVELPRNPELEARIQRLKCEQENREYKMMTKNVDSVRVHYPEDTIAYQIKEINRQLIAVLQFIFSVGAGFTFGFFGLQLLVGEMEFGFRLLLGVMSALIIALAEIYFLAKKLAEEFEPHDQKKPSKLHQD